MMRAFFSILIITILFGCTSHPSENELLWKGDKAFGYVLSLNGEWQIEEGGSHQTPDTFTRVVQVPGIVKNAYPAFEDVGLKSEKREAYWYRRKVNLSDYEFKNARLVIGKSRVWNYCLFEWEGSWFQHAQSHSGNI